VRGNERKIERESAIIMNDDPGVYECVLCYDTIFNVIRMILCDQEKKIRKEKKEMM